MKHRSTVLALLSLALALLSLRTAGAAEIPTSPTTFRNSPTSRLTIHEWGTFTSLQDEHGRAIAGINTDDQPLPDFVHRLASYLMIPANPLASYFYKGAPQCHPDVTMRLETPVVYFYPPKGAELPIRTTIKAKFRQGWLTEYYPDALPSAPGIQANSFDFGPLNPDVTGGLEWRDLRIGLDPMAPATDSPVWLAPRAVNSAGVATSTRARSLSLEESEHYLFYRGVAHLDAPLRLERSSEDGGLKVRLQIDASMRSNFKGRTMFRGMWLVDVSGDGSVAFQSLSGAQIDGSEGQILASTSSGFKKADFSKTNLEKLSVQMRLALVRDGLFEDEAQALLNTWQQAYFKSSGLRLFFLVPKEWTESVLSLESSMPADIQRTLVGRIELVSPRQRQILAEMGSMTITSSKWISTALNATNEQAVRRGDTSVAELGISPPAEYLAYLELGRFRNALILDEQQQRPTPGLAEFIREYGLRYFATQPQ